MKSQSSDLLTVCLVSLILDRCPLWVTKGNCTVLSHVQGRGGLKCICVCVCVCVCVCKSEPGAKRRLESSVRCYPMAQILSSTPHPCLSQHTHTHTQPHTH